MLNPGDAVHGDFIGDNGVVLRHYSVVMQSNAEGVVLAYTTSLKGTVQRDNHAGKFSAEDMRLAGWKKECRFDASRLCVVPVASVTKTGRISQGTFARISQMLARARDSRTLSVTMLSPAGKVITA